MEDVGGRQDKKKTLPLDLNYPIVTQETHNEIHLLAYHIVINLNTQNVYTIYFFICELMNFWSYVLRLTQLEVRDSLCIT